MKRQWESNFRKLMEELNSVPLQFRGTKNGQEVFLNKDYVLELSGEQSSLFSRYIVRDTKTGEVFTYFYIYEQIKKPLYWTLLTRGYRL